jgi:hypothetical protein
MHDDQDISDDLSEVRGKIDAARDAPRAALESGGGDHAPIRQALARLDHIAAEVVGVERVIAGQQVPAGE